MYFSKSYFSENNIPTEVEVICDKCGKIHTIKNITIFDKIRDDYCILKRGEIIKCNCGNICNDTIIERRKLQSIKEATISNRSTSIIRCPRCGSSLITTGARGVNFTWGLIGASKTVNRCGNCGHTWKPKK